VRLAIRPRSTSSRWPKFSAELARDEMVTVVVQVNGKVRDRLQVGVGTPEEEVPRDGT